MDIATLKTFLELSRTHHFGKTANALFITQSAVSARIKLLEDNLGVKLLTRDRNNIQLTPAGIRFLPHAEQIINTWTLARQSTALEEENKVLLSIAAVHSLWDSGLLKSVSQFYNQQEDIALNLEAHSQEQLFRKLRENSLDLSFMFEQPHIAELTSESLGHLELVLASSFEGQDHESLLNNKQYIFVDWGTAFANEHVKHFPNVPTASFRVSWARLALSYILEHGGSAYLPKQMLGVNLKKSKLFIVKDAPTIQRHYFAVFNSTSNKKACIELLINTLKNTTIEA